MIRTNHNVGQRAEQTLSLENFRGVDTTSSPLRVDPRRAVNCRNLLPYGGRNVKRQGWRQEEYFREFDMATGRYVSQPVRGMWWYSWGSAPNEVRYLLVHAGSRLYARREGESFVQISATGMGERTTEGFAFGGRLYLVGNSDYLVFGTWNDGVTFELRVVADDEDTYVPRTTMAINPTTDKDGEALEDTRRSLDAVNLLSSRRINTCMGRTHGGHVIVFKLDGGVAPVDGKIDMVIDVETADRRGVLSTERWIPLITGQTPLEGEAWIYRESDLPSGDSPADLEPTATRVGELYYSDKGAQLWISVDCPPPMEGRDNITVTFRCAGADIAAAPAKIGGCRFGVMFGGGGNADRLCLAGNPDYPNYQFFSGFRDPTYFPDNGWNAVGSSSSAIVGFSRISDGVLAVFKEEGRGEPVIYYQTAEDVPVYADEDGQELVAMKFKLYTDAGNAGESVVSRAASVDFYGDPLILSKNGVFGITYKTNVETADRYAAERSRNIRAELARQELSKACGAVFEGKYWLCVGGKCYLADEGYTFRPPESSMGHQYEWWILDNIPASVLCVADGRLYFGTEDGRLCYFRHESEEEIGADRFRDLSWERFPSGGMTADTEDQTVLIASEQLFPTLRSGDRIIPEYEVYALYLGADRYTIAGGEIMLADPDEIIGVRDGTEVVALTVGQSGLTGARQYRVINTDVDRGCFGLADAETGEAALSAGGFRLGLAVSGRELYVVDLIPDEKDGIGGTVRVSLTEGGEPAVLMNASGGSIGSLAGRLIHVDTVVSEWYTPVLDLGSPIHRKTLTRLTVAAEPGHSGRISFGYETQMVTGAYQAQTVARAAAETGGMGGLDLTALDFNDFSLSGFAASWTARLNARNVNYIAFRWLSEEPSDSRVDSIIARYKVTGDIRGGL